MLFRSVREYAKNIPEDEVVAALGRRLRLRCRRSGWRRDDVSFYAIDEAVLDLWRPEFGRRHSDHNTNVIRPFYRFLLLFFCFSSSMVC